MVFLLLLAYPAHARALRYRPHRLFMAANGPAGPATPVDNSGVYFGGAYFSAYMQSGIFG